MSYPNSRLTRHVLQMIQQRLTEDQILRQLNSVDFSDIFPQGVTGAELEAPIPEKQYLSWAQEYT